MSFSINRFACFESYWSASFWQLFLNILLPRQQSALGWLLTAIPLAKVRQKSLFQVAPKLQSRLGKKLYEVETVQPQESESKFDDIDHKLPIRPLWTRASSFNIFCSVYISSSQSVIIFLILMQKYT